MATHLGEIHLCRQQWHSKVKLFALTFTLLSKSSKENKAAYLQPVLNQENPNISAGKAESFEIID